MMSSTVYSERLVWCWSAGIDFQRQHALTSWSPPSLELLFRLGQRPVEDIRPKPSQKKKEQKALVSTVLFLKTWALISGRQTTLSCSFLLYNSFTLSWISVYLLAPMKLSTALCLLPSLAVAAPSHKLDKRLPNLTPVEVKNLDPEFDVKCGSFTI